MYQSFVFYQLLFFHIKKRLSKKAFKSLAKLSVLQKGKTHLNLVGMHISAANNEKKSKSVKILFAL